MKKKLKREDKESFFSGPPKIYRIMKLVCLFLIVSMIQVSAATYGQNSKLSLSGQNITIEQLLSRIEDQSDFSFFYNLKEVDLSKKINLNVENKNIEEILNSVLKGTDLTYTINDRLIIIHKETSEKNLITNIQERKITGKVTDQSGYPLPGVTIVIKGTNTGTITDSEGNYSLSKIPGNTVLVFSFVGMKSQEISITGQNAINIVMKEESIGLNEVIAVGYGTMKKSDLTGSVSSVSSKKLVAFPSLNVTQALQGRASGVQITTKNGEPGASSRVRVRGGTSLNAGSDPLYVVDGFAGGAVPPSGDIASIEILKDASATAIYGSRGANGVILITTKTGKRNNGDKININFNSSYSVNQVAKKLDMLNGTQFAEFINDIYTNEGKPVHYENPESYGEGTDWQNIIFRNGAIQNHELSASGGSDKINFYVSMNYYDDKGIVINSNYKRYSGFSNIDFKVGKNIKAGFRMFYNRSYQNGVKSQESCGGVNSTGVISGALIMEPTVGIYNEDGSYTLSTIGNVNDNPYAIATENTIESVYDQFQGNTFIDWTIIKDLVFKTTFGIENNNNRYGTYYPMTVNYGANVDGLSSIQGIKRTTFLTENYLSYSKKINDQHKFNLLAGCSYQKYRNEDWTANTNGYLTDSFLYWNLDGGADYMEDYSSLAEWEMLSYYGRFNYNYKDKYLVTFTGRYDGSSRLGKNNKWAFFPSGAFAWNIKQEPFLQTVDDISHLKLRLSYGETGNTDIGIYQSLANFSAVASIINEQTVNGVVPSSIANSDLSWETTKQTDIGFDIGLFNERILFTVDGYYMKTEDLLYYVPLPEYSGYSTSLQNIGSLENKGLEFGLNTVNIKNKNIGWTTDLNISFNRNKVTSLKGGDKIYSRKPGHLIGDNTNILREGSPAGTFYGYIYDGVNKEDGSPIYRDIAGRDTDGNLVMEPDGNVNSDDRTIIGNPHPDFIFGITNDIRYKNFDLDIFLQGVVGNDMYNFSRMELEWDSGITNQMASVLNRWTPTNTDTDMPKASSSYSLISSTRWIEKGTYIRFKNISLGYNFPKKFLGKTGIEKLRLYVSGQNLYTITNYKGYNPDVSYNDGNYSLGLDYGSYPNARSYTVGVNINF